MAQQENNREFLITHTQWDQAQVIFYDVISHLWDGRCVGVGLRNPRWQSRLY